MQKKTFEKFPAHQERSRQKRDSLIKAGYTLMRQRSIDQISIIDITNEAGCSVGAFYGRFENKDAFVAALLDAALVEASEVMRLVFEDADKDPDFAKTFARIIIERHRKYSPIYRASALRGFNNPDEHSYTKQYARGVLARLRAWAEARLGRPMTENESVRVNMSFQMLNGTILNALVGKPGPIMLDDPEFISELPEIFSESMSQILP